MADTDQPFQYTGGAGAGPAGAMPAGAGFDDENVGPPRDDVETLPLYLENESLIIPIDA